MRRAEHRRPAASNVPASVRLLMLLDLRDRLLQRLADPSVQRRRRRASVNLRHQHRREKRVDVRAQLALDLRALAIGDGQAVGWTRLDPLQDKCECALHLRLVLPAGLQERQGRDRRVGDVVAARFQPLSRPRGGRRAAVLAPPAVGALHGRQPPGPFVDRSRPGAGAGAVFGSGVVRWVCAQTAAPATTATDMTTASSLIRSPFADSCASFWTMPSRQWLSRARDAEPRANSSPGVTRSSATALWSRRVKTPRQGPMFRPPAPCNSQNEWTRESCTPPARGAAAPSRVAGTGSLCRGTPVARPTTARSAAAEGGTPIRIRVGRVVRGSFVLW